MTEQKLRTVAYCRVSKADQETSMESQIRHFNDVMDSSPIMVNCGCYVDNGISGRYLKRRKGFLQMLEDCELHKIDLILCKSIKRFGRCTLDTIRAVSRLQELKIPVFFETENIDTIKDRNNIILVTMAQVAQEEYEDRQESIKWAFRRKFEQGQLITNPNTAMGYKPDGQGGLIVVPEEAKVIKRIYEEFAAGMSPAEICRKLNSQGYRTAHGKPFQRSSLLYIIKSEKYKGDCLLQKWVVVNGKKVKNSGQEVQYYVEDHHEPIVSRELWDKANAMVEAHKKGPDARPKDLTDVMRRMIYCGRCGRTYIRSSRKDKVLRYKCNGEDPERLRACRNESVKRATLEAIFIRIYNDLRGKKMSIMEMPVSAEAKEVNAYIQRLLEQEKTYLQLQVRGLLQGALEDEYRKVLNQITKAEDRLKELLATSAENVQAENDMARYNKAITAMKEPLKAFRDDLFTALVKKIVVHDREHFTFELTNGQTARIRIYYLPYADDEIEEIKYEKKTEESL